MDQYVSRYPKETLGDRPDVQEQDCLEKSLGGTRSFVSS